MATHPLSQLPAGSSVFIDANILVYGINRQSSQCAQLLQRCLNEELLGVTMFEVVNEATHILMLGEARFKQVLPKVTPKHLRERPHIVQQLTDYWLETERSLTLNLLLLTTDESILRGAQVERRAAGLMTNDSIIVSCLRLYGITAVATNDADFERVSGLKVFKPDDLP